MFSALHQAKGAASPIGVRQAKLSSSAAVSRVQTAISLVWSSLCVEPAGSLLGPAYIVHRTSREDPFGRFRSRGCGRVSITHCPFLDFCPAAQIGRLSPCFCLRLRLSQYPHTHTSRIGRQRRPLMRNAGGQAAKKNGCAIPIGPLQTRLCTIQRM